MPQITALAEAPATIEVHRADLDSLPNEPLRFVVWIDDNLGFGEPNWEIDNLYCSPDPSEPLPQALEHAALTRSMGYPSLLMVPGQTPRPDGLFESVY